MCLLTWEKTINANQHDKMTQISIQWSASRLALFLIWEAHLVIGSCEMLKFMFKSHVTCYSTVLTWHRNISRLVCFTLSFVLCHGSFWCWCQRCRWHPRMRLGTKHSRDFAFERKLRRRVSSGLWEVPALQLILLRTDFRVTKNFCDLSCECAWSQLRSHKKIIITCLMLYYLVLYAQI